MLCAICHRRLTRAAATLTRGGRTLAYGPVCAARAFPPQQKPPTPARRAPATHDDPAQMALELEEAR